MFDGRKAMKRTRVLSGAALWAGCILLAACLASAGDPIWAVAADAPAADALVSAVAARAPYLLIFDAQGALLETFPNPAADSPRGAGRALAEVLEQHGVRVFIAGEIGRKLAPELESRGIRAHTASGPAIQAVKDAQP
jgi:predicted Fe-Mo cluster-binding NifX family protein